MEEPMSLIEAMDQLSKQGTTIATIFYNESKKPRKNVTLGAASMRNPPYGKAVNSIVFIHNGEEYIRGIDNNDGHQPKIFKVRKISGIRHGKTRITS
jgi:hypothetical protein